MQKVFPTFSPISVESPPGKISKSGLSAHASTILVYLASSRLLPNRMFSLSVKFWIQACCGTYATDP